MLIIAMIRCGLRVHADVEIEWKGCCHCRRPKEMASAILFPSSDERGYWQESISSPMVALKKSELETTVPMRNAGKIEARVQQTTWLG
jgi:hypothetical protein